MLESPPSWASPDRGNIRAPSGFTWGARVGVQESRGLKWRNWPRCSDWDDVICFQREERKNEEYLGAGRSSPPRGSFGAVPYAENPPQASAVLLEHRARERCTDEAGPLPPARIEPPVPKIEGQWSQPQPTLPPLAFSFAFLPSLPVSLICTSRLLFFLSVVKYSFSCPTIICVS